MEINGIVIIEPEWVKKEDKEDKEVFLTIDESSIPKTPCNSDNEDDEKFIKMLSGASKDFNSNKEIKK